MLYALVAATLFGLSTPLIRPALARTDYAAAAGYLYLGQALALSVLLAAGRAVGRPKEAGLELRDLKPLIVSVVAGGFIAPGAFTGGLARLSAHRVSLLLGLEIVFTLLIAVLVRRERLAARSWAGVALLLAAGLLVALPPAGAGSREAASGSVLGSFLIVLACAGWALDSNATAEISGKDATLISLIKGAAAAAGYLGGGFLLGHRLEVHPRDLALLLIVGATSYGLSLRFFVLALRDLGAAMTTSLFAMAPIVGFAASVTLFAERPAVWGWLALLFAAAGVLTVSSGRHEHLHVHEEELHDHPHVHDEHHEHEHEPGVGAIDGHSHPHRHRRLVHAHPHDADIHHSHSHRGANSRR